MKQRACHGATVATGTASSRSRAHALRPRLDRSRALRDPGFSPSDGRAREGPRLALATGVKTAADVMTGPAVFVTPADSLLAAAGLMAVHHLRHLPVIEGGIVVGVLSDRDVRTTIGDPTRFVAAPEHIRAIAVREAMSGPAITVPATIPLPELAKTFAELKIGALPVVGPDRELVGVVSYVDVLRAGEKSA